MGNSAARQPQSRVCRVLGLGWRQPAFALRPCKPAPAAPERSFGVLGQCRGLWQGRRRRLPCRKARRITPAEVPGIALKTVVAPVHRCYETYIKSEISGGSEDIGSSSLGSKFRPLHCQRQGKIVGYEYQLRSGCVRGKVTGYVS